MARTLKNLVNDIRVDSDSGLRTVTVDKAKAPEVYNAIVNDEVTLIDSVLLVLIDGNDSEVAVCNKDIKYSEAVKVSGIGSALPEITIADVQGLQDELDGKQASLPTAPETGTFVLTSTDGVLSWVAQA